MCWLSCTQAYPWKVGGFYQFQVMFKYGTTGGLLKSVRARARLQAHVNKEL
jgi:hypothetical protein